MLAVQAELNKKYKTTVSLVKLGDQVGVQLPSISTGLPTIDWYIIGTGGIPEGRIIEIFGPESAGKTTLALWIIGKVQKRGGVAALVDAEHALDPNHAAQLGVNMDELFISQPDSGEQALETVEAMVEKRAVDLIVVDSVSALVPQAELDGEMGDSHMGLQARLMSQAMRKLRGICHTNNVTLIFINQIREKIGVMFGSPETTTGGRALKFYASVRLDVRRRKAIMQGTELIGHTLEIKAAKNKVGTPLRTTEVDLLYGQGFDEENNLIEYAISIGLVQSKGAWLNFNGRKFQRADLMDDKELRLDIATAVHAKLTEKK